MNNYEISRDDSNIFKLSKWTGFKSSSESFADENVAMLRALRARCCNGEIDDEITKLLVRFETV